MTGLDPDRDSIMSVCCFVTDAQLHLLDEVGYEATVQHDVARLAKMDEWCTRTHADSGLTAACVASKTSAAAAAKDLLTYIRRFVPESKVALLAGNSVHADRAFLRREPWQAIIQHLHYRILDVSSIKEAARRWAHRDVLAEMPPKRGLHQAREDILESIAEARYYRDVFFAHRNG